MKKFKCEPYTTSPGFVEYLNRLPITNKPFVCPNLRMLPEKVIIEYESGPPRKYEKSGLFCTRKIQRTIEGHCGFNSSLIKQEDRKLSVVCSEGREIKFYVDSTRELNKKEKAHFLNNRR